MLSIMAEERGGRAFTTDDRYCIDNGAMIAYTGTTAGGVLFLTDRQVCSCSATATSPPCPRPLARRCLPVPAAALPPPCSTHSPSSDFGRTKCLSIGGGTNPKSRHPSKQFGLLNFPKTDAALVASGNATTWRQRG
eukprot:755833-Hanusia_phi.AAC.6